MSRERIAIIEDEPDILDVMVYNLEREGYVCATSSRGDDGIVMVQQEPPSLVLLDLMLPGADGLEICKGLKADVLTKDIPIIIVSAKGEESDVVLGLGLGADDYITKPFSPKELVARVKAVLRRAPSIGDDNRERIEVNDLVIDLMRHEVRIAGKVVSLTATEFRMLHQLAQHPGRAFTREQLLNRVLGNQVVVDRNIDVHIRSIRKKLGELSNYIETIRGIGYRFLDYR